MRIGSEFSLSYIIRSFGFIGRKPLFLLAKQFTTRGTKQLPYKINSIVPQISSDLDAILIGTIAIP
jgi:hypothetical protein